MLLNKTASILTIIGFLATIFIWYQDSTKKSISYYSFAGSDVDFSNKINNDLIINYKNNPITHLTFMHLLFMNDSNKSIFKNDLLNKKIGKNGSKNDIKIQVHGPNDIICCSFSILRGDPDNLQLKDMGNSELSLTWDCLYPGDVFKIQIVTVDRIDFEINGKIIGNDYIKNQKKIIDFIRKYAFLLKTLFFLLGTFCCYNIIQLLKKIKNISTDNKKVASFDKNFGYPEQNKYRIEFIFDKCSPYLKNTYVINITMYIMFFCILLYVYIFINFNYFLTFLKGEI